MKKLLCVAMAVLLCVFAVALAEDSAGVEPSYEEQYQQAVGLLKQNDDASQDAAYDILRRIPDYKDVSELCYRYGMRIIGAGRYREAFRVFLRLYGYKDADKKAYALRICSNTAESVDKLSQYVVKYTYSGLFGVIGFEDNTIIPPKWSDIRKIAAGYYTVKEGDKWGVVDSHFNYVLSPKLSEIREIADGYYAVLEGGKWGVVDGRFSYIFPAQWDRISKAANNKCVTCSGNKLGLIDLNGTVLQKCEWQRIGDISAGSVDAPAFHSGLIRVQDGSGRWGFLDEKGTIAIEAKYLSAEDFHGSTATVRSEQNGFAVIDTAGKEVMFTNPAYYDELYGSLYAEAQKLFEAGQYDEAFEAFRTLGSYKDSERKILAIYYAVGEQKFAKNDFEGAIAEFKRAGYYPGAAAKIAECQAAIKNPEYQAAISLQRSGKYEEAIAAFEALGDYADSATQVLETKYLHAKALYEKGDYYGAARIFIGIRGFKDVDSLLKKDQNLIAASATALDAKFTVGKYVTFGHYPQTEAVNDSTAIEWLVLARDGQKALLLSRYGLDAKPYNKYKGDITWSGSTLRSWLNGEFLTKAFSNSEQTAIMTTNVDNSQSQGYTRPGYFDWGWSGGNNTEDKVFLLSYAEANKYLGVRYEDSNNMKSRVKPTEYAIKNGAWTSSSDKTTDGAAAGYWWLRSPGYNRSYAACVGNEGYLFSNSVNDVSCCVRPALWVNLKSGIF